MKRLQFVKLTILLSLASLQAETAATVCVPMCLCTQLCFICVCKAYCNVKCVFAVVYVKMQMTVASVFVCACFPLQREM